MTRADKVCDDREFNKLLYQWQAPWTFVMSVVWSWKTQNWLDYMCNLEPTVFQAKNSTKKNNMKFCWVRLYFLGIHLNLIYNKIKQLIVIRHTCTSNSGKDSITAGVVSCHYPCTLLIVIMLLGSSWRHAHALLQSCCNKQTRVHACVHAIWHYE